jgi:hypothetical protein
MKKGRNAFIFIFVIKAMEGGKHKKGCLFKRQPFYALMWDIINFR